MNLGIPELLLIFLVALIVFGPKKLPEISRAIAKGVNEFKRASNELKHTLDEEIRAEERRASMPPPSPPLPTIAAPIEPAMDPPDPPIGPAEHFEPVASVETAPPAVPGASVGTADGVSATSHEAVASDFESIARGQHGS